MKMLACLGDPVALEAARRLKARFPVRKHIFFGAEASDKSNSKRAVLINGVRYPSLRRAALAVSKSAQCIGKWLEDGRATYAKD